MKTYKLKITSRATLHLEDIYNYIAQDSIIAAQRFEKHLKDEIHTLKIFPNAFPQFHFPKLTNFSLRVKIIDKGYLIVYEVDELFAEVIIHAIIHASQNID